MGGIVTECGTPLIDIHLGWVFFFTGFNEHVNKFAENKIAVC